MNKINEYLQKNPAFTQAVVGYIIKQDEILLGVRKRVSFGLGEQLLAGIGGKLEKDETPEEALKREFLEEIKTEITSFHSVGQVRYLFPHEPKWNQIVSIFIIDARQGEPSETEEIKPLWFKKTKLPEERMWPDNLYTIPLILSGEKITGIFLYNKDGHIEEYTLTKESYIY